MLTAAALAKKLEISSSTLRNWEKSFAEWLSNDYKNGKEYTPSGVQQFHAIKYLLHERGFTIDGARKEMERRENLGAEHQEVLSKLKKVRAFLVDLKDQLEEK
jgi:DNA-binding transcriptional MerR regulator